MQIKNILLAILDAIEYTGDKETFIKKFITVLYAEAQIALLTTVSPQKKNVINNEITLFMENPEKLVEIFKKHFTEEQIKQAVEKAAKDLMTDYLETITPTLSTFQQKKLLAITDSLNQSQEASL